MLNVEIDYDNGIEGFFTSILENRMLKHLLLSTFKEMSRHDKKLLLTYLKKKLPENSFNEIVQSLTIMPKLKLHVLDMVLSTIDIKKKEFTMIITNKKENMSDEDKELLKSLEVIPEWLKEVL